VIDWNKVVELFEAEQALGKGVGCAHAALSCSLDGWGRFFSSLIGVSIFMKTFPASAAGSRHTREGGCPGETLTGRRCRLPIPSCARGALDARLRGHDESYLSEIAMPVSGQVLDLSTLEQNAL
ncbi:hypothetical protein CK623_14135, partial [Vandammella animalimorsus]